MNIVMKERGVLMSDYIIRTRRSYEKALNDLKFIQGLVLGLLNDQNTIPYTDFMNMIKMFNSLSTILDECVMNAELEELKEGD